jgi:general secretion pathway protein G
VPGVNFFDDFRVGEGLNAKKIQIMKVSQSAANQGRNRASSAFTLIEILLVIFIILMLAGALVVFVLPQQEGAEKNTTRLLLNQVGTALDTYRLNIGHYPTEEEGGLGALLAKPKYENERLAERWQGPYLKPGAKLEDAWGNQILYKVVDLSMAEDKTGPPYKLYSLGPDGQPETEDDINLVEVKEGSLDSTTILEEKK